MGGGGAISYQFMMVLNPPFVIPTQKWNVSGKKLYAQNNLKCNIFFLSFVRPKNSQLFKKLLNRTLRYNYKKCLISNNESTICIENVPQRSRRSKNWTLVSVKPGELLRYWVAAMDILIKMISKVRNVSALGGARSLFASPLTSQAASWLDLDNF